MNKIELIEDLKQLRNTLETRWIAGKWGTPNGQVCILGGVRENLTLKHGLSMKIKSWSDRGFRRTKGKDEYATIVEALNDAIPEKGAHIYSEYCSLENMEQRLMSYNDTQPNNSQGKKNMLKVVDRAIKKVRDDPS